MPDNIRVIGTVNLTPTWSAMLPIFRAILTDGDQEGRDIVWSELARMAKAADQWNAAQPEPESSE